MLVLLGLLAVSGLSGVPSQSDSLSDVTVIRAVAPPYPGRAVQADAEGLVVVRVSIEEDGKVSKASLVTQTAPSDLFHPEEFQRIAKQWRFEVAEPIVVDLVFAFQLVDEGDDVGPATSFEPPTTVTVRAMRDAGRATEGN